MSHKGPFLYVYIMRTSSPNASARLKYSMYVAANTRVVPISHSRKFHESSDVSGALNAINPNVERDAIPRFC